MSEIKTGKEETESKEVRDLANEDNEVLSDLSYSSYDSIDNIKSDQMGQYTCDQCSEIPTIISTDINKKTILYKCKNHGQKEKDIKEYLVNSLNYNTNNWKCSQCENIQRKMPDKIFKYCQCNLVFCEGCYKIHIDNEKHKYSIDSNLYDLRCKKDSSHFEEVLKGYCYDCHEHYCAKCENDHISDFHTTTEIGKMIIEPNEIENIRKQNKEYRSLISYYESLIRLNNLLIYAFEKYRDNYYNLYNINIIAKNFKRNDMIKGFNGIEDKIIEAGDKNVNHYKYMNDLYKLQLKEEETDRIELENKFFNNYDFKVLCQLPLKNLRLLVLENNQISNISCLENAEFPLLVALNLNNNAIDDISVIEKIKFVDIEALLLRNNNIKDIKVFGKIKYETLRAVDLRDNKIEDITPFENHQLSLLQCLYLTGNNFGDINEQKYSNTKQKLTSLIECDLLENAQ